MRLNYVVLAIVVGACAGAASPANDTSTSSTTSTSAPSPPASPEEEAEASTTEIGDDSTTPTLASETGQINFALEEPVVFEENGVRLEVTMIGFQSREDLLASAEDDLERDFVESMLGEQTQTIVRIEARAMNNTDRTISWHPSQGTLQIGTEQRDANLFLSPDEIGGSLLDGTEDDGLAIFEFRAPRDELVEVGDARYVVGPAFDDENFDEVAGEADLTITWQP